MKVAVEAAGGLALRPAWADYLELTKPRLTLMVLAVALAGAWTAAGGPVDAFRLLHLLTGTALVVGGANALNMLLERGLDSRMERTRRRPLPCGRLLPREAGVFGCLLGAGGVAQLALATTAEAALVASAAFLLYAGVYTPLKRATTLNTHVGAVPGALPAVIGWAAVRGSVGAEAWLLFGILYLWQLPHFLSIAWIHRADYRRAGFRMLPCADPEGLATARQAVLGTLALLPVSLAPAAARLAGPVYFLAALLFGAAYLGFALRFTRCRTPAAARGLMRASLAYLPLLLLFLLADAGPL
ncbi:MAG: heme o synthase [Planctomycetota bacterium]